MTHPESEAEVWGLVPASGAGHRFGSDTPKQFLEVAGRPLLEWTVDRMLAAGLVGLTVAVPEPWLDRSRRALGRLGPVRCVVGGRSRQESVAACLANSPAEVPLVAVHDGARPVVTVADIRATIAAVGDDDGAILGRAAIDTVKRIEGDRVLGTVDRSTLLRAETPQVFRRSVLAAALDSSRADGFIGTDEASIVERLPGVRIRYVLATGPNLKLTEPQDLTLLEAMLLGTEESA